MAARLRSGQKGIPCHARPQASADEVASFLNAALHPSFTSLARARYG
jgi:hypothetical protein